MIILFGMAGSGKSVQGQILAEKYGLRWLSVGQLLRDLNDPEILAIQKRGVLVPDELVVKLMHEACEGVLAEGKNAILDGYPRDEWQAKWIVESGDIKNIEGIIVFNVPREELWARLQERGREDDNKESIEKRWELFEQTKHVMSKILTDAGAKIGEIDGVGTIEEVTARIEAILSDWGII